MKYFNKKVQYKTQKGILIFDSKKELMFYQGLEKLELNKEISNIILQPQFSLIESFKYGDKTIRGCNYTADFMYFDNNLQKEVVVEIKSKYTSKLADYILRKKMFLKKYGDKYIFKEIIL